MFSFNHKNYPPKMAVVQPSIFLASPHTGYLMLWKIMPGVDAGTFETKMPHIEQLGGSQSRQPCHSAALQHRKHCPSLAPLHTIETSHPPSLLPPPPKQKAKKLRSFRGKSPSCHRTKQILFLRKSPPCNLTCQQAAPGQAEEHVRFVGLLLGYILPTCGLPCSGHVLS